MSKGDARRVTIVEELLAGRTSIEQAARLLNLSVRQIMRLKAEAAANGPMAVLHKNRGRKPANALDPVLAETIVDICTSRLAGYNFCHMADVLAEDYGIFVSVSTLSRLLRKEGIRSPKAKRRAKKHRCRAARPREGELAQMDASRFDWLSDGSYLHLHGAVDDATGRVLALRFDKEETFEAYCQLMFQMNRQGCLPREIYADARSIFVCTRGRRYELSLEEELAGMTDRPSQFARALRDIGGSLIIAGSPQAKGGIERLWGTLQDRLVKDMWRQGISTMEQANDFLKSHVAFFNRRFAVPAAKPEKAYLPKQDPDDLALTFSKHATRVLDSGLSFSFLGTKYRLPLLHNHKRVSASPHDTLTIATSSWLGLKVIFKGMVLIPEKIQDPPRVKKLEKPRAIKLPVVEPRKAASRSPWHNFTPTFYSQARLHDIFADELSTESVT